MYSKLFIGNERDKRKRPENKGFCGVCRGIKNYEKYLQTKFVQHAEMTLRPHLA